MSDNNAITPILNCDGYLVESNMAEIVEFIFSRDPQPPNSIKLVPTEDSIGDLTPNEIFTFVKTIALYGMRYLFGTTDFSQMTAVGFGLMKDYLNSFGFDINYDMSTTEDYVEYKVSFRANTDETLHIDD